MALLPHTCRLQATLAQLDTVHAWCLETWPHTHGATWSRGLTTQVGPVYGSHGIGYRAHECTWWFQREEDLCLFAITWHELRAAEEDSA